MTPQKRGKEKKSNEKNKTMSELCLENCRIVTAFSG